MEKKTKLVKLTEEQLEYINYCISHCDGRESAKPINMPDISIILLKDVKSDLLCKLWTQLSRRDDLIGETINSTVHACEDVIKEF
jgi:hypothetical protein